MLYLMHRSKKEGHFEHQTTWTVGMPPSWDQIAYVDNVYAVQADGDELKYIRRKFTDLPYIGEADIGPKVVRWFGDDAKFIAGNL